MPGRKSMCLARAGFTFDPTNRGVGGFNLIPVAVARDIRQAMPVAGSFVGRTDAFMGMSVEVLVTSSVASMNAPQSVPLRLVSCLLQHHNDDALVQSQCASHPMLRKSFRLLNYYLITRLRQLEFPLRTL